MSSFKETLEQKTKEAEEIIKAYLPKEEGSQKTVMEAINYSVKVGGKRLRPILMREAFTEPVEKGFALCSWKRHTICLAEAVQ